MATPPLDDPSYVPAHPPVDGCQSEHHRGFCCYSYHEEGLAGDGWCCCLDERKR